jgi:hypothetical protein
MHCPNLSHKAPCEGGDEGREGGEERTPNHNLRLQRCKIKCATCGTRGTRPLPCPMKLKQLESALEDVCTVPPYRSRVPPRVGHACP